MENTALRENCIRIIERVKDRLLENKKCIAAFLLGSMSHDQIWKWSDIQIAVILDDGYKGKSCYPLADEGMNVILNVFTLSSFKDFLQNQDADNYIWKAFSKSTKLFSKDLLLDDLMEDAFYIGDVMRQQEMLLGFSGAVYYLNKAEKNFYVKDNLENVLYFIPQIAENIAWIEIFNRKFVPERELIPQGKALNPDLFEKIYDPLYHKVVTKEVLQSILDCCVEYLESMTEQVYEPVLSYLKIHGNLEHFTYNTRPHGFGLNFDWLVRVGIVEQYGIQEKIPICKEPVYRLDYRLKNE
ncbi:nucleotidyltransferase domain-containing protein [Anaerosporobacter faecicola]|uniref:hypothetical protein n=1 Tax=Anaerosporobacter faecicola TaxID=2718714 RepID=UPI001439D23C|nr:hypothetical protein [Anaerosporobacter faecicola]